ncbi:4-oxalocrotonate tautomerase [Syntrophobotulus glycolicus DSM 8271]|uniref:4-oxalocrotonate tautomerase n=1 Tax=Syntrophobotulus glycolicus (strain DSM 8271 / FlGlyR) TaxID=645991 RepID=F0SYD1_SYNGF|nr:tautomerase family protein [Syntrophobotulus glycolicus]ADY55966.1 4-oxalocrotonate tautomerase [Syntrophobotulus glycolicus DSM 8271]
MPHISVKLWPGKTEEEKIELTDKFVRAMEEIMGVPERSISVAIEEVPKELWTEQVYNTDIMGKPENLYKKPGYTPSV